MVNSGVVAGKFNFHEKRYFTCEDFCKFMKVSRLSLLRMRNDSDKNVQ